jgi:DNA polymerase III, delta subunit, C terminal
MLAAESDPAAIVQVGAEMQRALNDAAAGTADPVATADRWARDETPLRLRCIENWLTERIRAHFEGRGFLTEMRAGPHLQAGPAVLNIRGLFELLDSVRELKSSLETPINRGLALETLLRRLAAGAAARGAAVL